MKRLIAFLLHPLRHIKWWYLAIVILVFAPLSVYALRQNSITMGELKQNVVRTDEIGDGSREALLELQSYVFNHMNTSTEVELAERYARDVSKAQQKAAAANGNRDLYAQAEAKCNVAGVPGVTRAGCVQEFISSRTTSADNPKPVDLPEPTLYKFDFVAPKWSPDLAGLSILIVFTSLFIVAGKMLHKAVS